MRRYPLMLGLVAVMGMLVGTGIQCGGEGVLPGVCLRDSDCVLDCRGTSCCGSACPCGEAHTKSEAARIAKQREDRCSDVKMECPAPPPEQCDWNSRYLAVCRAGACVAEPIEGGAAPEFRAPELPSRFTAEDPRCRACESWGRGDNRCVAYVEWQCSHEGTCRMAPECDAACCEAVASAEVGLDAAPWAAQIAAAAAKPETGVLVFAAAAGEDHRLGFVELPGRGVVTTDIVLPRYEPAATWVDGSSDFLIVAGDAIERISFPTQARRRVLGDVERVTSLDVAPTGDVVLVSSDVRQVDPSLISLQLGPAESAAVPVTWSAHGDAYPRWSADGKHVALSKLRQPGRVVVVDATTGQFEGGRTDARFVGPAWHPSGEFLLMWLQDMTDYDKPHCDMVVVTPDRTRHARLGIVSESRECASIAVSPDGARVATWVTRAGAQRLELFTLGSSQPDPVPADGSARVLEWVPLQLAALGLEPPPPPPPPPPEPEPPPPEPPPPEPPKPEPPKPKPEPPEPEPEPPKPKPEPPKPKPEPPSSIEAVVFGCANEHPSSETSVTVRWWLAAKTGHVSKVEIVSTSTPEALAGCIESTARLLAPDPQSAPSVTTKRVSIPPP